MRERCVWSVVVVAVLVGCSDPAPQFDMGSKEPVSWEAYDKLNSGDGLMGLAMAADMGDWAAVKKQAAMSEFQAVADEFANADIPSKYASSEREAAKTETVESLRKLIELGKSGGSDDEVKAAYEAMTASLQKVGSPRGK